MGLSKNERKRIGKLFKLLESTGFRDKHDEASRAMENYDADLELSEFCTWGAPSKKKLRKDIDELFSLLEEFTSFNRKQFDDAMNAVSVARFYPDNYEIERELEELEDSLVEDEEDEEAEE